MQLQETFIVRLSVSSDDDGKHLSVLLRRLQGGESEALCGAKALHQFFDEWHRRRKLELQSSKKKRDKAKSGQKKRGRDATRKQTARRSP